MSTTVIVGKTQRRAFEKMDLILGEFKYKDIKKILKQSWEYRISLTNGDEYIAIESSELNLRGRRFRDNNIKFLIEKGVDLKTLEKLIIPFLFTEKYSMEYWN